MGRLHAPGLTILMLGAVLIFVGLASRLAVPGGATPEAAPVRTADLVFEDRPDGSIAVRDAHDRALIDVVPPATNGFLRVLLAGQVRERRREAIGAPSVPFHLTSWSDGRLTLDDPATHKLIELDAFGPDNAGVFARLLGLSRPPP